jgi:hypothetical protein
VEEAAEDDAAVGGCCAVAVAPSCAERRCCTRPSPAVAATALVASKVLLLPADMAEREERRSKQQSLQLRGTKGEERTGVRGSIGREKRRGEYRCAIHTTNHAANEKYEKYHRQPGLEAIPLHPEHHGPGPRKRQEQQARK